MSNNYYIDFINYPLSAYAKNIEKSKILTPSRKILQEETRKRCGLLGDEGIKTLDDLLTACKKNEDLENLAQKTKIPEDFLAMLVREIKSMRPKPVKLNAIADLDQKNIQKLADLKIKTTKDLFPFITTKKDREKLSKKTGINAKKILELTKLTDVARIKYVGANFARVLVSSPFNTLQKVSQTDPQELMKEVNAINEKKEYYKGKIGVKDMNVCIVSAKAVPIAIEY